VRAWAARRQSVARASRAGAVEKLGRFKRWWRAHVGVMHAWWSSGVRMVSYGCDPSCPWRCRGLWEGGGQVAPRCKTPASKVSVGVGSDPRARARAWVRGRRLLRVLAREEQSRPSPPRCLSRSIYSSAARQRWLLLSVAMDSLVSRRGERHNAPAAPNRANTVNGGDIKLWIG
jgi:hypothetical protein